MSSFVYFRYLTDYLFAIIRPEMTILPEKGNVQIEVENSNGNTVGLPENPVRESGWHLIA